MTFRSETGKLHDTQFFFHEYFCPEEVAERFSKQYADTGFMIQCFEEVKKEVGEIPEFLSPLFTGYNDAICAFTVFFVRQVDYAQDDIDSFILKTVTKSDALYRELMTVLFPKYPPEKLNELHPAVSPTSYIEAVDSLDFPGEVKYRISMLIGNFNYAVSLLPTLLKKVYLAVSALHKKYEKELSEKVRIIESEDSKRLLSEAYRYDFENSDKTILSVSLLNQFFTFNYRASLPYITLVGYEFEETIRRDNDLPPMTAEEFAVACGNELRLSILKTISENGELTGSQIARNMGYPLTTLFRHLELLRDKKLICVSRRDGLQLYYKLNVPLFQKMQSGVADALNKLIGTKE